MVQSPSWEANWFAASQEIPHISRNPKVHYRTHKRPPPLSILCQPNPVHIHTSHLLRSILILSTHLRVGLPNGLRPSGFLGKTLYTNLSSSIQGTCPAHLITFPYYFRKFKCKNRTWKCNEFLKCFSRKFDEVKPMFPYINKEISIPACNIFLREIRSKRSAHLLFTNSI